MPEDISDFVESMTVTNIGLWADEVNVIVVDYMIGPYGRDEILAVQFSTNPEIPILLKSHFES